LPTFIYLPKQSAEGACFYEISSISEKHAPQHAWSYDHCSPTAVVGVV